MICTDFNIVDFLKQEAIDRTLTVVKEIFLNDILSVLDLTEIPFILQVEHSMEQRDENCTVPSENNKTSAIPGERNSHRNGWEMRLKAGLESDLERDIIAREFTQCRERSGKPPGFLRG